VIGKADASTQDESLALRYPDYDASNSNPSSEIRPIEAVSPSKAPRGISDSPASSGQSEREIKEMGDQLVDFLAFNEEANAFLMKEASPDSLTIPSPFNGRAGIAIDEASKAALTDDEWQKIDRAAKHLETQYQARWDDILTESIRASGPSSRNTDPAPDASGKPVRDANIRSVAPGDSRYHPVFIRRVVLAQTLSALRVLQELEVRGFLSPIELDSVRVAVFHLIETMPGSTAGDSAAEDIRMKENWETYRDQIEANIRILKKRLNQSEGRPPNHG